MSSRRPRFADPGAWARRRAGSRPRHPVRRTAIELLAALVVIATLIALLDGPNRPRAAVPARHKEALAAPVPPSVATGPPSGPVDPALFSPGACVRFAPGRGAGRETVFLDAGHGGLDPGGVGVTESGAAVSEATVNLRVEMDVMNLLRARGYSVVVSRTRATTVIRLDRADVDGHLLTVRGSHDDVAARDVCADKARAAILIGIYMNSGGAGGAGCLTAYDADRPFAAQNRRLAVLLQQDVLGIMNAHGLAIPDGGVSTDDGLGSALSAADESYGHLLLLGPSKPGYFSTPSRMPGALIEPLFLTDPFEASVAASSQGEHLIAAGIARAVGQYFAAARAHTAGMGLPARTAAR